MEYIYAAMLLHKAGKAIDFDSVRNVLQAAGVAVDDGRVKALVAALSDVDIDKAIAEAAVTPVAAASASESKAEAKPAEKKAEKKPEEAAVGLGSLFG